MNQPGNNSQASSIVCEGVIKQFPNEPRPAVDHISLEVAAGSLVVLLGPSGCGKTTLLKMINRLYEPSGGHILIDGVDIEDISATQLRRRIGYVIQQVGLFPHMTIAENIAVVPELLGWDRRRIDERIDFLLGMVKLPLAYRQRHPRQLSGGEQQRVGLARALAADPAIMLMDEPFAAIDAIARGALQEELLNIHRSLHKTVIFVTHDVEEALCLADKIAVLRTGQLVQYGTPFEIITRPRDAFVEELAGGGDILRRLSVMKVAAILEAERNNPPSQQPEAGSTDRSPAVHLDNDLRTALSRLLESGSESIAVLNGDGRPVGRLSLADLRSFLIKQEPAG